MEYRVDRKKIREGIEEMMKWRTNEVLDNGGPITLASSLLNYQETQQLAIKFGLDTREYDNKINSFLEQSKLEGKV